MSIAEGLTAELMAEQEEQSQKAEERARRISELVSSPMGGAPLIMSGSSEAQLAQFNNTNARVQAIGERQLTVQERIDRELKRIGQREANIERLFEHVLEPLVCNTQQVQQSSTYSPQMISTHSSCPSRL